MLEVKNLNIKFKRDKGEPLHAIRNISFSLNQSEILGVVGESGCGKSLTNLALMGLLPPNAIVEADSIKIDGHEVLNFKEKDWNKVRGKTISMIFQDPMSALNPCFTVEDQMIESIMFHDGLTKKQAISRALDLLNDVGIPAPEQRLKSYVHQLSGGMAQRIMIAMSCICSPKILIADEPTTALDVTIQKQILKLIVDLKDKYKMGVILVTHDMGVVSEFSDRTQVMYAGEIVETGTTGQILSTPKHPYTSGLIQSIPGKSKTQHKGKLPSIKGIVPSLIDRPKGCQFAPRCDFASEVCNESPQFNGQFQCHSPIGGIQ